MISTLKKKLNKKGFTLAELLIVVAIIAILVAIAIPVFSAQLSKAKAGVDTANLRSAISIANTELLLDQTITDTDLTTKVSTALDNPAPKSGTGDLTIVTKTDTNGMRVVDKDKTTLAGKKLADLQAAAD